MTIKDAPIGSKWLMANGQIATKLPDIREGPNKHLCQDRFNAPCFQVPYAFELDGTVGGTENDLGYRIIAKAEIDERLTTYTII